MNDYIRAKSIFYPDEFIITQNTALQEMKFVQYTSAEAAVSIIKNEEIWLRDVQCMNDFREVNHGIECLVSASQKEEGKEFKLLMESIFPGIMDEFSLLFDSWIPAFKYSTYISCVSEHTNDEDMYGRLSMWRAYGGNNPVAIVLNSTALRSETDVFSAYTFPVLYQDHDLFHEEFKKLTIKVKDEKDFVSELGKKAVIGYLFDLFKTYALCVKHPGFQEEKEWRIVYNPVLNSSERVSSEIVTLDGVPQIIHKIPLKNIPEENFTGAEIPELIDKIIIGPSNNQSVIMTTFIKLLKDAGCKDAEQRVRASGVPLRL